MAHTNGTGETEEQRINRLARRVAARADANYAMSQRLLAAAENAEAMLVEIADRATGAGQHLDRVARSKDKRMRGCGQISLGPRAWRQYWADRSVAESKGMTYLGPIYQHNRFLGLAFMSAEGWLKPHGEFLDGGPLWHPESDAAIMLARGGRPHHPPLPPGPRKRLLQSCIDGNELYAALTSTDDVLRIWFVDIDNGVVDRGPDMLDADRQRVKEPLGQALLLSPGSAIQRASEGLRYCRLGDIPGLPTQCWTSFGRIHQPLTGGVRSLDKNRLIECRPQHEMLDDSVSATLRLLGAIMPTDCQEAVGGGNCIGDLYINGNFHGRVFLDHGSLDVGVQPPEWPEDSLAAILLARGGRHHVFAEGSVPETAEQHEERMAEVNEYDHDLDSDYDFKGPPRQRLLSIQIWTVDSRTGQVRQGPLVLDPAGLRQPVSLGSAMPIIRSGRPVDDLLQGILGPLDPVSRRLWEAGSISFLCSPTDPKQHDPLLLGHLFLEDHFHGTVWFHSDGLSADGTPAWPALSLANVLLARGGETHPRAPFAINSLVNAFPPGSRERQAYGGLIDYYRHDAPIRVPPDLIRSWFVDSNTGMISQGPVEIINGIGVAAEVDRDRQWYYEGRKLWFDIGPVIPVLQGVPGMPFSAEADISPLDVKLRGVNPLVRRLWLYGSIRTGPYPIWDGDETTRCYLGDVLIGGNYHGEALLPPLARSLAIGAPPAWPADSLIAVMMARGGREHVFPTCAGEPESAEQHAMRLGFVRCYFANEEGAAAMDPAELIREWTVDPLTGDVGPDRVMYMSANDEWVAYEVGLDPASTGNYIGAEVPSSVWIARERGSGLGSWMSREEACRWD